MSVRVFKDPHSDAVALVFDGGDAGLYAIAPGQADQDLDEVPDDWVELYSLRYDPDADPGEPPQPRALTVGETFYSVERHTVTGVQNGAAILDGGTIIMPKTVAGNHDYVQGRLAQILTEDRRP